MIDILSPEIISKQATINVGLIGNVSHGKSTIVKALTGIKTGKHSKDLINNKTINLGYANAKIYKCETCPKPSCYKSFS